MTGAAACGVPFLKEQILRMTNSYKHVPNRLDDEDE